MSDWLAPGSDLRSFGEMAARLAVATVLGAVAGIQREKAGKAAGLRTHMLVALGAALFVVAPEAVGMDDAALSRIIQGVVAGIGFVGAGAILKVSERQEIEGLTTSTSLWATAAVGVAAGVGAIGLALVGMALAWIVLAVLLRWERQGADRD
jgi:putative Mg2+ transporter-C (MgtC) family protein